MNCLAVFANLLEDECKDLPKTCNTHHCCRVMKSSKIFEEVEG